MSEIKAAGERSSQPALASPSAQQAPADFVGPAPMAQPQKPVILVVDDDPAFLSSLCFLLEAEGYEVIAFSNGGDVLALERLPDPLYVITSHQLPGMTGLDLLERLHALGSPVTAIVITSRPDATLNERADALGVSLVVEKLLLDDTLLDGIRRAVGLG